MSPFCKRESRRFLLSSISVSSFLFKAVSSFALSSAICAFNSSFSCLKVSNSLSGFSPSPTQSSVSCTDSSTFSAYSSTCSANFCNSSNSSSFIVFLSFFNFADELKSSLRVGVSLPAPT